MSAPQAVPSGRDIELLILDDEEAAAAAAAARLAEAARAGLEIALTGGSTPRRAYELAAAHEPDWSRAGAWWGDERCVPPDDERSNYRLARESLLDRLSSPPRVHRIRGELDPAEAAAEYVRELGDTRLDLVLLGLGPDGHVASLFPGAPTLEERERRVVAAEAGLEPFVPRVTLTLPVLCSGRFVLFLVTGEAKADAARAAFGGEASERTPGSLVRAREGVSVAILDHAAASALSRS
jgi:6-phosphogluconolactonase